MYLILNYYISTNEIRKKELEWCINRNLENQYIEKIILLNDQNYDLSFIENKDKVIQITNLEIGTKLNYQCVIDFANTYMKNKICIIANTDIIFDNSLDLLTKFNFDKKFIALSRYELFTEQLAKEYSQDSWIFRSPLNINTSHCKFDFGKMGCDGKIAYVAHKHGYRILNPALSIKSYHNHRSNFRTYKSSDKINKPYLWVYPSRINQISKLKLKTDLTLQNINNN